MSETAQFTFRIVGKDDKFFSLRAPTWKTANRGSLDSQQLEAQVAGWLMDNATGEWHVSSFKFTPGYEPMPHAFETANALCVLIESAADLVAFEKAFAVHPSDLLTTA